ncbi:DUF3738 domain-containing protein [Albibacterium sp.]|uniref:DUF3738 domain-containing protein n=1 Tax=Albibacterium sp. TaxID=2952885 RepID=UPI002BEBD546|nr:DUF3738 domain-containing protein [Albibacterium sp.]
MYVEIFIKFILLNFKLSGEGIQLKSVAQYLEDVGLVNMPVVDQTNNIERYDITFTFMPKKGTYKKIRNKLITSENK